MENLTVGCPIKRHKNSFSKGKWKHKQHVASITATTMHLTGHTCSSVDTVLGSAVEAVRGLSDKRNALSGSVRRRKALS